MTPGWPSLLIQSALKQQFFLSMEPVSVGLVHYIQPGWIFTVQATNYALVESISLIFSFPLLFLTPLFILLNLISQDDSGTHRSLKEFQPPRLICCSSPGSSTEHQAECCAVFQILPSLPACCSVSTRYSHPWSRAGGMNGRTDLHPVKSHSAVMSSILKISAVKAVGYSGKTRWNF